MAIRNTVEFCIHGNYALFSDPTTRLGGEKMSYQVPTYQALKGILESVYWKPTLIWQIDQVRVINPIQTQSKGMRPLMLNDAEKNDLAYHTYLRAVRYQVSAHFIWNEHRPELAPDRNENKHHNIAKRMIERGGRRDIFLGTRECQGYVEACVFGEGEGAYDKIPQLDFGLMFYGFEYPDETGRDMLAVRFWRPVMEDGIIRFPPPADCPESLRRDIRPMKAKTFIDKQNFMREGDIDGLDAETLPCL